MKINMPVTNVETLLPANEFIYSATDLKGIIVEANEAFAKLSDFTREELIGKPHNTVRHPDMPQEAFEDLWRDLKAGRPWRGIVKNRRQDGGFYWVVANASPVRENGQIVGYQSVRSRPSREEVSVAERAYQRLKNGDKSLRIEHGRVVRGASRRRIDLASLRSQMNLSGIIVLILAFGIVAEHLGKLTIPDWLMLPVAALAILHVAWYLGLYATRLHRDLAATKNWLSHLLSSGDMTRPIEISRSDVIGDIATETNTFASSVQATMQGIADIARQVDDATNYVHSGMKISHASAIKQSDATASAAAAIEQVTVSIGEVARHATVTKETATHTGEISRHGASVTHDATLTIQILADTVHKSAEQVESLGQRSAEISKVTDVIKEIADQTNLLALNAAIEAARAGETGRVFAVVADEVRKLAERTAKATEEIGGMIESIRRETQEAVDGMRTGAQHVAEGVTLVHGAEQSLRDINTEMEKTMQMVADITHASNEQQEAMNELARNVENVASMTGENVSVVDQTGAAVESLKTVVTRMQKTITQYRL